MTEAALRDLGPSFPATLTQLRSSLRRIISRCDPKAAGSPETVRWHAASNRPAQWLAGDRGAVDNRMRLGRQVRTPHECAFHMTTQAVPEPLLPGRCLVQFLGHPLASDLPVRAPAVRVVSRSFVLLEVDATAPRGRASIWGAADFYSMRRQSAGSHFSRCAG